MEERADWRDLDRALDEHAEELRRFVAEQRVQTNEVQRAWALLPALLSLGAERVDLIELGASAGLLLALDRYAYRYRQGSWGDPDAGLVLEGDDRGGPPAALLAQRLRVERRVGVDLEPVALDADGARLLEAFVWAGQDERIARLRRAVEIARPLELRTVRGDYVEALPALLAARRPEVTTVVLSSVTTTYLPEERNRRLEEEIARGGEDAPLAWLSLEAPRGDRDYDGLALELATWPGGRRQRLARADFHGRWLEWEGREA